MSARNQSPLVTNTLNINYILAKKNKCIKWGAINAVLFSILFYDFKNKCPYYTTYLHYIEYVLIILFAINTVYHFISYLYHTWTLSPVIVNLRQKELLGLKDGDNSYKFETPNKDQSMKNESSSLPQNLSVKSWVTNSSISESVNQSMSSPSWVYMHGSPSAQHYQSANFDSNWMGDVNEEQPLQEYLRNIEEKEKLTLLNNTNLENSPKDNTLFWNNSPSRMSKDILPMYKKTQYQLAPLNSEIPHMLGVNEEGSPKSSQNTPQVWHKLQVDPQHLIQWNANLRKWISATVLDRVVKEIQIIDDALLKCGLTDIRIGHVGLDRLKKTTTSQIIQHIPTLPLLIPFLEISNNQEYLVQRIKELSLGGCMSDFKWNGGGNLHGKNWDESLPTDSAILMHFFATYLDTQLMPVTQNPEGLPFTSQYFCKTPEKPKKNPDALIIYQSSLNPPHFLLVIGEETCEISKGRNNLIHTILLFLYKVAVKHHGMLGRMNLGKSGVNILWVVNQ